MPSPANSRYAARSAKLAAKALDHECALAELVADTDCSLAQAAITMNLSYPSITIYWRRIKARVGAQAC